MTVDETTNRKVQTYNTYDTWHVDEMYEKTRSPLLNSRSRSSKFFQHISPHWVPGQMEDEDDDPPRGMRGRRNRTSQNENNEDDPLLDSNGGNKSRQFSTERHRGFRRRFFLFLTEPDTSLGSAAFFFVLIFAISISNFIMIMQTMDSFQYTPTDCHICGGKTTYLFDDDLGNISAQSPRVCQCPPEPYPYLEQTVDYLLYFFAVEWTLRVLFFADAHPSPTVWGQFGQWLNFLTSSSTLIDALAIWPYFFESLPKGLVSLRLLRLFRVFQLVRLGQYNTMFLSLTNVLQKSLAYLRLLVLVLLFGAAFFGSMLFWLEQGTWKYWEPTGDFQYVRMSVDGVNEEISPFRSIPVSFWWFLVTATTVGYGDYYPTSTAGQWVAVFAMLSGVLVVAFPVSVFSDLWSEELKELKGFNDLFDNDVGNDAGDDGNNNAERGTEPKSLESQPRLRPESDLKDAEDFEFLSKGSRYVVMEKTDLNEIVASLRTIRQEQQHIKRLLKKYYVAKDE